MGLAAIDTLNAVTFDTVSGIMTDRAAATPDATFAGLGHMSEALINVASSGRGGCIYVSIL